MKILIFLYKSSVKDQKSIHQTSLSSDSLVYGLTPQPFAATGSDDTLLFVATSPLGGSERRTIIFTVAGLKGILGQTQNLKRS